MSHAKPTKEELDQKIEEALNADPNEVEKEEDPKPTPPTPEKEDPKPTPTVEEEEDEDVDPEKEEDDEEEDPEKIKRENEDLKKKQSASARENQKILAKNRVLNQAIVEAEEIPEPTEDELKTKYGDNWEVMTDVEKE